MTVKMLERDLELQTLEAALGQAEGGQGSTVLISGEAGIGKTTLLRAFAERAAGRARLLVGACDDLLTPRTLGPFRDMARQLGGEPGRALAEASDLDTVLSVLVEELGYPLQPTVCVVEDLHWADDPTLDVIRYLGRRMDGLRGLLVITYRDDDVLPGHALQRVLGGLTGPSVLRIGLQRLSREAVAAITGDRDVDAQQLFELSGGNPFYVSEVVQSGTSTVPVTVVDAVLARVGTLSAAARTALEVLSVIPMRTERWLADSVLGDLSASLDEAEQRGMLVADVRAVRFRHELARRAILQTLTGTQRATYHARVLRALGGDGVEPSRLMHHAVEAGDTEAILRHGAQAAREAARLGGHRQAVAHYEHVLGLADRLAPQELATVLTECAYELYHVRRYRTSAERAAEAVRLWEQLDRPAALGQALMTLSRSRYWTGDPRASQDAAERAISVLEPLGVTPGLAQALSTLANVLMMADNPSTIPVADRARELAETLGRQDLVAGALNYLGTVNVALGRPEGEAQLRRALDLAIELDDAVWVGRITANLARSLIRQARYEDADPVIELGLAYARQDEFIHGLQVLESHRRAFQVFRGQWDEAEDGLRQICASSEEPGIADSYALAFLGRLLARRGDDEADELLGRAWALASGSGSIFWIGPVAAARVELRWLQGDRKGAVDAATPALTLAELTNHGVYRGQLLRYLKRAGERVEVFEGCPEHYALGIAGDWRGAAAAWAALRNPYEHALELAESGAPAPTIEALRILDELGAVPAATMVRQRLRALGVLQIPRGPHTSTRANPAGLTTRQLDVLVLLAEGLTNSEIAERLVLSPRTVDHHVSAILDKLGVDTRRDAARVAAELGVTPA